MEKKMFLLFIMLSYILLLSACQSHESDVLNLQGRTITLDMERPAEGTVMARRLETLASTYNVNFSFFKIPGDRSIKRKQIVDGINEYNPPADILILNRDLLYSLAAENLLYPLGDFISEDYFRELPPYLSVVEDFSRINGNLYGLVKEPAFMKAYMLFYNKDILQEANLPDIFELQISGDWTLRNMLNIAREATTVKNENRGLNTFVMNEETINAQGGIYPNKLLDVLNVLYDVQHYETVEDDNIQINYIQDNHIESIAQYINFFPYTNPLNKKDNTMYIDYLEHIFEIDEGTGFAALPKIRNADNNYIYIDNCRVLAIPITEEDPEIIVQIAKSIFKPEEDYEIIVTELEHKIAGDEEYKLLIKMINSSKVINQNDNRIEELLNISFPQEMERISFMHDKAIEEIKDRNRSIRETMNNLQSNVDTIVNEMMSEEKHR
ncbi:MAG: hypothetical protein ACOCRK_07735 [bacterium]